MVMSVIRNSIVEEYLITAPASDKSTSTHIRIHGMDHMPVWLTLGEKRGVYNILTGDI